MSAMNNEVERKRIKDCLDEISDSMTRIEAEREFIKEATNSICEELQLKKKVFNRMAKVNHKQNYAEEVKTDDEFQSLYEVVTNQTTM